MFTTLVALVLAAPATLTIGSKAPPLAVDAWVKGEPVKELQTGTPYVVEFWATWCGPCIASIPHLTQMQKDNPSVQFIAVAASERKSGATDARLEKLKSFVANKGDAMGYRIAFDGDRDMGKSWLDAAGAEGIPTAFIVGKDGTIEWIGHPMEMDKPLTAVVAGTWDRTKAKQAAEAQAKSEEDGRELTKMLGAANKSGDYAPALAKLDEMIKQNPNSTRWSMVKFQILSGPANQPGEAIAVGKQLLGKDLEAEEFNQLAWVTATEMPAKNRDLDFALAAAEKAVSKSKSSDPAILDTLARVYWERGDKAKALTTQQQAVALGTKNGIEGDMLEEMKESLDKYQGSGDTKH
ncbi:MAG: redoxin family protein [Planctomycetes bacterium]|nr:redoxin family protein [Planctomycetota bacterium]